MKRALLLIALTPLWIACDDGSGGSAAPSADAAVDVQTWHAIRGQFGAESSEAKAYVANVADILLRPSSGSGNPTAAASASVGLCSGMNCFRKSRAFTCALGVCRAVGAPILSPLHTSQNTRRRSALIILDQRIVRVYAH